ncbi:MAG: hypothetical protein ABI684_14570 [Nitrospirota bacterium]
MLPDRLYRIRDAADLLALRPSTLYHLIATNAIEVVRPSSRAVRISEQELIRIQQDGVRPRGMDVARRPTVAADLEMKAIRGSGEKVLCREE